MTSKDRILTAMRGGQPDRVPISSYEINPWDPSAWQHADPSYAVVLEAIMEYADCIWMWGAPIGNAATRGSITRKSDRDGRDVITTERIETPEGRLTRRSKQVAGLKTSWAIEPLLKGEGDIDRWLSIPFEDEPPDLSGYFDAEAAVGDRGIVQGDIADPLCLVAESFDLNNFLVLARENLGRIRQMLDVAQERLLVHLEHLLENTPVPAFRIVGPEYAAPPIMSPPHSESLWSPTTPRSSI